MTLTFRTLLLLVAVILLLLAAFRVDLGATNIAWLGVALFAAAFLVPDTALGTGRGIDPRR